MGVVAYFREKSSSVPAHKPDEGVRAGHVDGNIIPDRGLLPGDAGDILSSYYTRPLDVSFDAKLLRIYADRFLVPQLYNDWLAHARIYAFSLYTARIR